MIDKKTQRRGDGNGQWNVRKVTFALAAGASRNIDALEYVALVTADGDLEISSENGQFVPLSLRRGYRGPEGHMGKVTIHNATGSTVTGTIITGTGDYIDFQAYTSTSPLAVTLAHDPLPVLAKGTDADAAAASVAPLLNAGKSADGKVRTNAADTEGRQVVIGAIPANMVRGSAHLAVAGAVDLLADPGAGKQLVAGLVVIANDGVADDVAIILDDATEVFRIAVKPGTSYVLPFAPGLAVTVHKALRADVVAGGDSMRFFATALKVTP